MAWTQQIDVEPDGVEVGAYRVAPKSHQLFRDRTPPLCHPWMVNLAPSELPTFLRECQAAGLIVRFVLPRR